MDKFVKCECCERLFNSADVVFVPTGGLVRFRVDARASSFPYHHQATHSRIGEDGTRWISKPDGVKACYKCRRTEPTVEQRPLQDRARDAWSEAVKSNPALAKFAPKRRW